MTQEVCMLTLVGNMPKESHASCNFPFFSSESKVVPFLPNFCIVFDIVELILDVTMHNIFPAGY